ncbi:MAG: Glycosyl transferase family 2 [Candidatus Moranbacteria bacterium GW2011_GWA2_39_41]|nr:MAG: Glycosyl transferase family 2 [Candidatus Moranbacteria bacterium GW2011_GWA2_39_41]
MEKLYIVMPAYNEEANIVSVVQQWHPVVEKIGNGSKLVIVDDGSKDATYASLQELSKKYAYLEPTTKANSGHGSTLLFAYNYSINKNADYIFQTDSDGQTLPEEFWSFWDLRNKYDFIIGSRSGRMDGLGRVFVTKILRLVIWVIFGVNIKDANTPFRLMKSEKLKTLLDLIPKDFFLSNVLISTLIVLKKQNYKWKPITFKPRQGGINSINFKRIIKIGISAVRDFKEVKRKLDLEK